MADLSLDKAMLQEVLAKKVKRLVGFERSSIGCRIVIGLASGAVAQFSGLIARRKAAIRDALLLRGSADFSDLADYRRFIDEVVNARNRRHGPGIDAERKFLQPLPDVRSTHPLSGAVTIR